MCRNTRGGSVKQHVRPRSKLHDSRCGGSFSILHRVPACTARVFVHGIKGFAWQSRGAYYYPYIHKFAFSRVRVFARSVHARSSPSHRKNRLLQRPHFLHSNARASELARCDFSAFYLYPFSPIFSLSLSSPSAILRGFLCLRLCWWSVT